MKLKKFVSILICTFMALESMGLVSLAAKKDDVIFGESFNEYKTFEVPENIGIKGRRSRIESISEENKVLSFYLDSTRQGITATAAASGEFYIFFDIKADKAFSGSLALQKGTTSVDVLKFQDGVCNAHNGKKVTGMLGNQFKRVAVCVRPAMNTYDIYIDGKAKYTNYRMIDKRFTDITAFALSFTSTDGAKLELDNVCMNTGSYNASCDFKKQAYLDEAVEETPLFEATVKNDVYFKMGFEEGEPSFISANNKKDNVIDPYTTPDGRNVYLFSRVGESDMHLDLTDTSGKADSSSKIIYQFDLCPMSSDAAFAFCVKDVNAQYIYFANLSDCVLTAGTGSKKLNVNTWYTISAVYDWYKNTYDVYVNNEKILSDYVNTSLYDHSAASIWRLHTQKGNGKYLIDNLAIYGGDAPWDISNQEQSKEEFVLDHYSIFDSEKNQIEYLKDKIAYHPRSSVLTRNENKEIIPCETVNDTCMVPLEFFQKAFDVDATVENGVITIGKASLSTGSDTMTVNGRQVTLSAQPYEANGVCYAPLVSVVKDGLQKKLAIGEGCLSDGMIIMSDSDFEMPTSTTELQALAYYTLYERPSMEKITEDYDKSELKDVHPRVLATQADFDRIKQLVQTDSRMKNWYNSIIQIADDLLQKPTLIYELRDGVRLWYVSTDFMNYMEALSMAYKITGDKKYSDRAWLEMKAIASFPDWHTEHHIDVGGLACGYAIGYDWLYDTYTEEQRQFLEDGAFKNCFSAYIKGFQKTNIEMTGGILADQNHNMVMNAGSIMMGIAFHDVYPEIGDYIISGSVRATEKAIYHFAPNGSWFEGISYGCMTLQFYSYELAALDEIFHTNYSLDAAEGTDKAADFVFNMQAPMGTFGFSDVETFSTQYDPGLVWFAKHFGKPQLVAKWFKSFNYTETGWLLARAMLWYDPADLSSEGELANEVYYKGDEIVTARDSWDSTQSFFGAKGGKPSSIHGHMDAGMFVYFTGNTQWFIGNGTGGYNEPNFWDYAGGRWKFFVMKAEGHNCLVINPEAGGEYATDVKVDFDRFEEKPKGVITSLNMTYAHNGKAKSAERGFFLTDNRRSLVIRDEVVLDKPSDVYSFMYTLHDVKVDGNTATITNKSNGEKLKVEVTCNQAFELITTPTQPLESTAAGLIKSAGTPATKNKLYVKVNGSGEVNITVKCTPDIVTNPTPITDYDVPMSTWQIPDGSLSKIPKLDSLKIGDEYCNTAAYGHNYIVPDLYSLPAIEAVSSVYDVQTTLAADANDVSTIRVTDKNDPTNYTVYTVKYTKIAPASIPGLTEYPIYSVVASAQPQPENAMLNAFDRNLTTRWSADGKQNLLIDLGTSQSINTVMMAFASGDVRQSYISVEVSENGTDYAKVYEGISSGTSLDFEAFPIGEQTARYIRISGTGNTVNNWNSWAEVAVGRKE